MKELTAVPNTATATASDKLEQQIMDPSTAKNEREWWASREIERLRTSLAAAQTELEMADKTIEENDIYISSLKAGLAAARGEVQKCAKLINEFGYADRLVRAIATSNIAAIEELCLELLEEHGNASPTK